MCRLWTTEPSKSLTPFYFVAEGLESSLDTFGETLVDLGYNGPTTFASAEIEACQLNKGNNVILLHVFNRGELSYITGLATPVIPNISQVRRNRKIESGFGLLFIIFLGIILGIALAGLGVRGEPKPYLLEWLSQNIIILTGIGFVLFIISFGLCFRFLKVNFNDTNYETALNALADLITVLDRNCSDLQIETITIIQNPSNIEEKENAVLPEVVRMPLEHLVSVVDGLIKIQATILDINLKTIKPEITRTY